MDDVFARLFFQSNIDSFCEAGRDIFADKISFDRKLAVASVNQYSQLNPAWPAKIGQCVQSRAGSSSAEENIVDDHHGFVINIKRDLSGMNIWRGVFGQIVAMHADVDGTNRNRMAPNSLEQAS